jgi:5-methylcytosine-specific restriction endonuclease McrA
MKLSHERTPERKAYEREWKRQWKIAHPEFTKWYEQTPKRQAYKKAYYQRPEVMLRYKNRRITDVYRGYQFKYRHTEKAKNAHRVWKEKNRTHWRERSLKYFMERYNTEPTFKTKALLRNRLFYAFRKFSNEGKVMSSGKYGIDYGKIASRLVATRPADFNERQYHIDHIIPLSKFDFNNPAEVAKAFAPENHQWLPAEENIRKSDKIEYGS